MTSAREQMLEAAMQELLIRFELVMPRHNWSPELRESMKRGYDSLVGGMPERDQQALCGEAFDCGGMAANPAAYMVEADKKLAVDREWALKEVRAQVLEECKAFTRHAEDCAIWRPDAPACTCGYQAWLNREQPGWYAGKGWYSHSALVGPSHVDTTRLAPQAGEAVYVEQHDAEQMRLDRLLFGNSPTRLERAPDGRLVLRAIPAARMVGVDMTVGVDMGANANDFENYAPGGADLMNDIQAAYERMVRPPRPIAIDPAYIAPVFRPIEPPRTSLDSRGFPRNRAQLRDYNFECAVDGCNEPRNNGSDRCQKHRDRHVGRSKRTD